MEEATGYVNSLKMPHLKQILRSRGQYDRGRKPALQNRLVEGLRKDYAEGWTHGRMLNTKIVPFNGRGRDPKELIGLHLKSFQLIGRRYGVLGGTLRFTDGEDQVIMMRPSRRVATAICIDFEDSYWNSWGYCVGREDEYQWEREERVWEKEEVWRKPAPIIEAVRGIRRNSQDESTSVVLGLRCEGMSKMGFFCCEATRPTLLYTYPSYGDIWLADDEERGLADIRLLHGP